MDSNLLKEAIADAKAVKQTALANAKVALEEAFSEKYQQMFAEKLKEDANQGNFKSNDGDTSNTGDVTPGVNEQEIDELIKELESEVGGDASHPEPDSDESPFGAAPAAPSVPGAESDPSAGAGAPPSGETPVAPPGYILVPIASLDPASAEALSGAAGAPDAAAGAPDAAAGAPDAAGAGAPPTPPSDIPPVSGEETDEEVNLDELLESLREEIESDEEKEEKSIDEVKKLTSSGVASSDNKKPAAGASSSSGIESGKKTNGFPSGDAKDVAKDPTDASRPNQGSNATSTKLSTPSLGGSSGPLLKAARPNSDGSFENTSKINEENDGLKKQLNEAEETIKYVKGQLNEINLLNAKLLYTNKLFKEYGMNNEQKMRIVEMFDLSKNVREVKLTYANIAESLNFGGKDMKKKVAPAINTSVQSITEGLASKPVGSTKPSREIISESRSAMVSQFQKLAGIKTSSKK